MAKNTIVSKPSTPEYRDSWNKIFGNVPPKATSTSMEDLDEMLEKSKIATGYAPHEG